MNLIPAIAIVELSKVLTFGAEKYGDNNWSKGIEHSRLFAASLRHLYAYKGGELLDPETGISHVSHALCNLVFLTWMRVYKPELDDLVEK